MTYPLKNGQQGPYDRIGRGGGRSGGRGGGRGPGRGGGRDTGGGRPRPGPPSAAGTRERIDPEGKYAQPYGPLEEHQVNLLSFYNSITTDDEFREVFGIFDKADIETLRRNPNMLAMASPYWWERLETFHTDVETGKRTLDIQRRMRRYEQAEEEGRLPVATRATPRGITEDSLSGAIPAGPADTRDTMAEDIVDASQEGADYIPGNYSPAAERYKTGGGYSSGSNLLQPVAPVAEAIRRFGGGDSPGQERPAFFKTREGARDLSGFKTIGKAFWEEGELPISMPRPEIGKEPELASWIPSTIRKPLEAGKEWFEERTPFLPHSAHERSDKLLSTPTIPVLRNKLGLGSGRAEAEARLPGTMSQAQRELFELTAVHDEAPFLQQLGSDPANLLGPAVGGLFAAKGLVTGGIRQARKLPFSELGQLKIGRLPATVETLASHTSRGVGRIAGLPGIRLLTRPLAGKSVEFNQHIEGSADEALARSPTLWHSNLEMFQRFKGVVMSQVRSLGDQKKEFGLVTKNGVPTNIMTKVAGQPYVGDLLENANLRVAEEILEHGTALPRGAATFMKRKPIPGDPVIPDFDKRYVDAARKARRAEDRVDALGPSTGKEPGAASSPEWRIWSKARGYTPAEIKQYEEFLGIAEEGKRLGYDTDTLRELEDVSGIYSKFNAQFVDDIPVGRIMPKSKDHPEWDRVTRLTRKQIDMVRAIRLVYQDALTMMKEEGVNVKELGEFMDGFYFAARKVGRDWKMVATRRGGGAGFRKKRTINPETGFVKLMSDMVKEGKRYLDPMETMSVYLDEVGRLISKKRLEDYLRPFSREKEVEKIVKTRKSVGTKMYNRSKQSIATIRRVYTHGGGTASSTRAMMRRTFPTLADDIDAALSYKGVRPEVAVKLVTDSMVDKNVANWPDFRKELRLLLGSAPKMIEKKDVQKVVATLAKSQTEKARITEDVYAAVFKGLQEKKETQLKQLLDRMESIAPMTQKAAKEVERALKERTDDLGRPFREEGATDRLPGMFFGETEELGRIRSVKNPQEFANRLEGMIDDLGLKQFGIMDKFVKLNDALRWMKTTWDFGHVMIQGLPLLARDPEAWGKSVGLSMRAFLDDGMRATYVTKNHASIMRMIQYGGHIGSTEFTDTMSNGGWFAKFPHVMQSMPGPAIAGNVTAGGARMITRLAGRFQESFEVFLDVGRIETWQALEGVARRSKTPEKALYELGSFVNKLTGVTSSAALGIGATQRQIESSIFLFSPRYTRASLALISDMVRGGLRGNEARIALGRLMAGQMMIHNAVAISLGQEPNLVPGRGNFLKWEIEGQYVGFGGKFNALLNLSMDLFEQFRDNPEGLITKDIFSSESYDNSTMLRRLRYMTSAMTGNFLDFMTETSPIGKRFRDPEDEKDLGFYTRDVPIEVIKRVGPFYIDGVIEALGGFVEPGPKAGITGGVSEAIGLSSFPIPAREMRDRKREELAQEYYGMSIDKVREDINYGEMLAKIDTQPEMIKLIEASDDEARQFARNDERFEIQDQRTDIDDRFVRALEDVSRDFGEGRFGNESGKAIREVWKTSLRDRRVSLEQLREGHEEYFAGVDDYYREMADRNPTMAATAEFMDRAFVEANFDSQGRPDYIQFDAIKADLVEKYGAEAVEASEVNARLRLKQLGLPEPIQDMMKAWDTLRPYWDTYKEVLPERDWAMWRVYDSGTDVEKASMETSTKFNFKRWAYDVNLARKYKQQENYDMDEALMIFYDRRPMNRDLYERYIRRGQR